jgi:signal transduction histidine kinase
MVIMNYFTINLLSSTRAYINGESHYSRSHKNASRNLLLYLYSEDPAYFKKFEDQIHITIQDSVARVMLSQNKDKASIRKVLLSAGNTEDGINDFLWLGNKMYRLPFLTLAFSQWKDADALVGQLHSLGLQVRAESRNHELSDQEKLFFAKKVDKLSEDLMVIEVSFSKILIGAIRRINFWVYLVNAFIIFVLFGSSILKSGLLINSLSKTKNELELKNQLLTTTNEELDRFVYSASHDLRAPIASLKGLLLLANEEKDMGEIKFYLKLMLQTTEKQDRFISDIIDYSRNKKTDKVEQVIQLEELVDESIAQHIYYYKDHAVQIKKEITVKEIFTDPVRLKIILNNLISNAIKYRDPAKPETIIKITSYQTDENTCIDVIDNGIGIEKDELDKVFDMFFVSPSNHIGTGLGLYIAKESIQKLGGFIDVQSHKGMGTKFTICLPLNNQQNNKAES